MMCTSGPPCMPGKTTLSMAAPNSAFERIIPERGPRSVLWVVEVTICACGTGDGCAPPATSPAKCAMSTRKSAPTLSAIWRMRAAPADYELRALGLGDLLQRVIVNRLAFFGDAVRDDLVRLAGKIQMMA